MKNLEKTLKRLRQEHKSTTFDVELKYHSLHISPTRPYYEVRLYCINESTRKPYQIYGAKFTDLDELPVRLEIFLLKEELEKERTNDEH